MSALVVIPARFASSRFPGKPLADIGGKTMIERVYRQAKKATKVTRVIVATDDQRIADHVTDFGGEAVMTRDDHQSGTDRIKEAVEKIKSDQEIIVNVQGDEPFIHPEQIDALIGLFEAGVEIATLVQRIDDDAILNNPDRVKAVRASNGRALYFSRSAVPYDRKDDGSTEHFLHIGMYAYRTEVLKKIAELAPSPLEISESLEQLRWLENGYSIQTAITEHPTIGIDTPADLKEAIARVERDL